MIEELEDPRFPAWATIKRYVLRAVERRERRERELAEQLEDAEWTPDRLEENRERIRELVAMTRPREIEVSQETGPEAA